MGEVTKSRAMCNQGQLGMGRGRSRQDLGLVEVLFQAQTEQAETNSWTSLSMVESSDAGR